MPHWMCHEQNGVMPVYSTSEMVQAQVNGWVLLNTGESADRSKMPAAVKPKLTPLQELERKEVEEPADMLALPVVQILPQLSGIGHAELEALAQRERSGPARPGLLSAIADEVGARRAQQEREEQAAQWQRDREADFAVPETQPSAEKLEQERIDRAGMCPVHSAEPAITSEPAEAPAKRKPGRPRKVK